MATLYFRRWFSRFQLELNISIYKSQVWDSWKSFSDTHNTSYNCAPQNRLCNSEWPSVTRNIWACSLVQTLLVL